MDGTLLAVLAGALWLAGVRVALILVRTASHAGRGTLEHGPDGEAGPAASGATTAPRPAVARRGPALPVEPPSRELADTGYGGLVLDRLARHARVLLGARQAAILVRDDADPRAVVCVAGSGVEADLVGSRLAADQGALGLVMRGGRPVWFGAGPAFAGAGLEPASRFAGAWAPIVAPGTVEAAAPSAGPHVVTGALVSAVAEGGEPIDAHGLELLLRLADLAAAALQDAPMRGRIEPAMRGGVSALEAVMRLADSFGAAHAAEVTSIARAVGERMALDRAALIELELAARLLDVGRLAGGGPETGAEMLAQVPGLEVVAIIVRHRGERWDGGGRPERLSGDRIPLASRVIAVCDAYAQLTSEAAAGGGLPWGEALASLEAGAGSRFDPAAFEALGAALASATPGAGA